MKHTYDDMNAISLITTGYLASLGVLITWVLEDDIVRFERTDEPEQTALDMELFFIPPKLESDRAAQDIVNNISNIMEFDLTLSESMKAIILKDINSLLNY